MHVIQIKLKQFHCYQNIYDGNGNCFIQKTQTTYIKNTEYKCDYDCKTEKCPNYKRCKFEGPKCYLNCHDGFCINCNMTLYDANKKKTDKNNCKK